MPSTPFNHQLRAAHSRLLPNVSSAMVAMTAGAHSYLLILVTILCFSFTSALIDHASRPVNVLSRFNFHNKRSTRFRTAIDVVVSGERDDDEIEFMYETGFTKRKKGAGWKKTDNRDSLPFVVSSNTADGKRSEIGTYLLDSSTGCGDLLDLSGKMFLVQRVSYLYKYESGGFRVFKKKLDVTATKTSWSDVTTENNQGFLQ